MASFATFVTSVANCCAALDVLSARISHVSVFLLFRWAIGFARYAPTTRNKPNPDSPSHSHNMNMSKLISALVDLCHRTPTLCRDENSARDEQKEQLTHRGDRGSKRVPSHNSAVTAVILAMK